MAITVALVDLDNTLHDYNLALTTAMQATADFLQLRYAISTTTFFAQYKAIRACEDITNTTSGLELRHKRFRALLDSWPITHNIDEDEILSVFANTFTSAVTWFPGAQQALKLLNKKATVLIITESYADIARQTLNTLGLPADRWQALITYAEKVTKRDGSAYRLALQWLNCKPENTIMIGDNWTLDILGANKANIHQIWVSAGKPLPAAPPNGFITAITDFRAATQFATTNSIFP